MLIRLFFLVTIFHSHYVFSKHPRMFGKIPPKASCSVNDQKQRGEETFKAFKSDGCSAYFDGRIMQKKKKWLHCCIVHDMSYWAGGLRDKRKAADFKLGKCVSMATNNIHGALVVKGVRAFGGPGLAFPWRWNYGWKGHFTYFKKGLAQREMVFQKIDTILDDLPEFSSRLSWSQKNYIIKNYLSSRRKLAEETVSTGEEEEGYEERLKKINDFLSGPVCEENDRIGMVEKC